jgi:hypothetical protein
MYAGLPAMHERVYVRCGNSTSIRTRSVYIGKGLIMHLIICVPAAVWLPSTRTDISYMMGV